MIAALNKYRNRGKFSFLKGDKLKLVSKEVPNLPGVYYIERIIKQKINTVYIGASGTIQSNGKFKNQLLKKRINNQQEGKSRQDYFDLKIRKENIEEIIIHWFVTFDKNNKDLPGFVEGVLFQKFFEEHSRLPEWNKKFPN